MKPKTLAIEREKVLKCMEECKEFRTIAVKLWPELEKEGWIDITKEIHWHTNVSGYSEDHRFLYGRWRGVDILCAAQGIKLRDYTINSQKECFENVEFKLDKRADTYKLLVRE